MADLQRIPLTDVANQSADLLPAREALALVNITAVNIALAVNAGTFGSTAAAAALQHVAG